MKNISTKFMILGLTLIGIAIYIRCAEIRLYGNEFFLVVIGCIMSLIGFFNKD